jgi:(2Fe-2S) ferredoxin
MAAFTHHIFICCNQREAEHPRGSCDPDGSEALRDCFKQELKRRGLNAEVRANSAGCLDQCELGPTIVIYPQAIWYGRVTPDDVPRIVEQTVIRGELLPDLFLRAEQLNCKAKRK